MARTALTPVSPTSINTSIGATAADVTFTALDATNNNSLPSTGRELLLFNNTDTGAHTVTIWSVADDLGRKGDIVAYSIGASTYSLFGPFPLRGWKQTDGNLWIDTNSALIKVLPIKIPTTI